MYTQEEMEILASPLGPVASRVFRRATYEAAKRGLVCVPKTYPLVVVANQNNATAITLTLDVPQAEGPFCVTEMIAPTASTHLAQRVRRRIRQEWMDDSPTYALDALLAPRDYIGRMMSSPLVVTGGSPFDVLLYDVNGYTTGEGMRVDGLAVRAFSPNGTSLCGADADAAQAWAQALRQKGQWWAIGTESAVSGAQPVPEVLTSNVIVECVVLSVKATPIEGEIVPTDVQLRVGTEYVTPGRTGPIFGPVTEGRRFIILPGLNWPAKMGDQVVLQLTYPSGGGTQLAVRATLIGRRGGDVGACWPGAVNG